MKSNQANNQSLSARISGNSHVSYKFLKGPELALRCRSIQKKYRKVYKNLVRLKAKLAKSINMHGVHVDEETHNDLCTIVEASQPSDDTKNHFAKIFWEQQKKASLLKKSSSMKWHPLLIKWAIYLRHKSSKAYETLRDSKCIFLPSQRTLRDYTHFVSNQIGFSDNVDKQLYEVARVETLPEFKKCVAIIIDEMHIREDLVFDKHSGKLIGFVNLGEVNNHLLKFEQSIQSVGNKFSKPLAKCLLVFLIRGLFIDLQFPYAQFATSSLSGDLLFQPFWEAVKRIERCGLKVVAVTADGAAPNRAFFLLHGLKHESCKIVNPFTEKKRHIHGLSDGPHLLKTIRNCLASDKRLLWNDGKYIRWSHIVDLYNSNAQNGLTLIPKIKYEHIHLTSFSKMRVDLAAQVMSNTVAKALRLSGKIEVAETAHFIELVNNFFDCMNSSTGYHQRNKFLNPFRRDDFRLKWLEETFLKYLEDWEKSVDARKGFSQAQKKKLLLSVETRLGLKFTVRSMISLIDYLFSLPGVSYFFTERVNQDPLEKFFGMQRQRGRVSENPKRSLQRIRKP